MADGKGRCTREWPERARLPGLPADSGDCRPRSHGGRFHNEREENMMRLTGGCKWGLAVLLVLALVATGCAKKEVVRSGEEAGKPAAEAAAPSAKPETIVSEP